MKQPSALTGRIINIQHFSIDDGPGIRTTVFLKGCPLRCAWCHNPESQACRREILFRADRCRSCGACVSACPASAHALFDGVHRYNRAACTQCGRCAAACAFDALETVGRDMTVPEILADVLTDRIFYEQSGGGITVSGGEPTAQPEFASALLAACRAEGLHTCIETCGHCAPEALSQIAAHTDLFLFDYKLTDPDLHRQYTGASNDRILSNLAMLHDSGANIVLRCPMIPDVNMDSSHIDGVVSLLRRFNRIARVDLEPYHPLGVGKSAALGKTTAYARTEFLEPAALTETAEYIRARVSADVKISGAAGR